ncbi:MAG: MarR family transcriptional regulator [Actinomycetota bacterium]|nr:MarR family transcriptional regulator [Actinomycetota bacterium]
MLDERSEVSEDSGLRSAPVVAWMRLLRVGQKIGRVLTEDLKRWDLNMAQFDTLARVGSSEGITQQELAESLLVTKGNVCQMLDRLERRGLLYRRPDGRANRLFLTVEGRRLFDEVILPHEALVAQQFSILSAEEQGALMRLLGKLDRSL